MMTVSTTELGRNRMASPRRPGRMRSKPPVVTNAHTRGDSAWPRWRPPSGANRSRASRAHATCAGGNVNRPASDSATGPRNAIGRDSDCPQIPQIRLSAQRTARRRTTTEWSSAPLSSSQANGTGNPPALGRASSSIIICESPCRRRTRPLAELSTTDLTLVIAQSTGLSRRQRRGVLLGALVGQ